MLVISWLFSRSPVWWGWSFVSLWKTKKKKHSLHLNVTDAAVSSQTNSWNICLEKIIVRQLGFESLHWATSELHVPDLHWAVDWNRPDVHSNASHTLSVSRSDFKWTESHLWSGIKPDSCSGFPHSRPLLHPTCSQRCYRCVWFEIDAFK